jgi:hypothetical protein
MHWPRINFIRELRRGTAARADAHASGGGLGVDIDGPATAARLVETIASLRTAMKELEGQFGSTCTNLMALSEQGRSLVSGSERLVEIASGRASGIDALFKGMKLVEKPLAFLEQYRNKVESSRMIERLRDDRDRIDQCLAAETEIGRILAPLRTVRTLFKVVAAPLGEHVERIFSSLVEELELLHSEVEALVGTRFENMRGVRVEFRAMVGHMEEQQVLWARLSEQRALMERSLRALEEQIIANSRKETHIGRASKEINGAIEEVVTCLQWQDILNQKLDHSARALHRLSEMLSANRVSSDAINFSAQLELRQIETAERELERAEIGVRDGIEAVRAAIRSSDQSSVVLSEFETLTTSSDGMVQQILETIESIERQIESARTTSSESLATIRAIEESASALTTAVRELSERTLLVGMNAQVQSCKVAHGAGLGVLSARTSDISGEVARIGDVVAKRLDTIVGDLRECVEVFRALSDEAEELWTEFHAGREGVEGSLHALRDEAFRLVQATGTSFGDIDATGARTAAEVGYGATMAASFEAVRELLRSLIRATGGPRRFSDDEVRRFTEADRGYTMASEHAVLNTLATGVPIAAAASVVAAASIDPELFDADASSDGAAVGTAQHDAAGRDSNVELF